MTQTSGGISVDRGYRASSSGGTRRGRSRVEDRAAAADSSQSLGEWGQEEWELPGQGDSGPKCGEYYPEAVCDSCGELQFGSHNCGRRSCPDCWHGWADKASVRGAKRIQSFRYTQPDDHRRQVAHAVVSPPDGDVMNERQYWDGRSKAAEIAKEKGFRGFAVVPHPYRGTDRAKRLYRQSEVSYGFWVWWRNDMDGDEELVRWSPHYHIIGFTTPDMNQGDESDEWVYNFITSLDRFGGIHDRDSHKDVYGTFRYLLSHTGYPGGSSKQVVTWCGELANSVFVEEATADYQIEKPSEGVQSVILREIEEAVDVATEDDEDSEDGAEDRETDDMGKCPCDGCDGLLIDVFDVRRYLEYNRPPPEVAHRMTVAYEWRMGEVSPPPGMKRPETEEHAQEAFEAML